MRQRQGNRTITVNLISSYAIHLKEQEKSISTIQKYTHDLKMLLDFVNDEILTKTMLIHWKEYLLGKYAPASVNTILAATNSLMDYCGWHDLKVKALKIQKPLFCDERKELTRAEYTRLVRAAQKEGNQRLSLLLQTICSTGIRVSELQYITIEAVQTGRVEINNKGKHRTIFITDQLRRLLSKYVHRQKRMSGPVFITKTGKPIDRSNIWRDMKSLCKSADVEQGKVFPHNLRHLFARTYYSMEKDLVRLADILGHSNVNTTRIYTIESGAVHLGHMERMKLLIT